MCLSTSVRQLPKISFLPDYTVFILVRKNGFMSVITSYMYILFGCKKLLHTDSFPFVML